MHTHACMSVNKLRVELDATDHATITNRLQANSAQQPSTPDTRKNFDAHGDLLKTLSHRCSSISEGDEVVSESLDSSSEMTAALILAGA